MERKKIHVLAWYMYSKTCPKRPLQKKTKLVFRTDYCLMQVKSIAECSLWSILQYFQPSCKLPFVIKVFVAVGNVSGYRCVSDCNSRGREFDPGPVPYFRGDWSWKNFYGHSPPFCWMIHSRRVVVSYKRKYVHELLVICLFKPAQEKMSSGELTIPQWP